MKSKYATIKDVANASGFSVSTISRVLNGKPDVSEKTKKKVLEAIEEVGYIENRAASIIKNNPSYTIGMIFECVSNPFTLEILNNVQKYTKELDFKLILMNTEFDLQIEKKSIKILLEHRVDGLLYFPTVEKNENLKNLVKRKFPVLVVGRDVEDLNVNCVFTNDRKGGYLATSALIRHKRKRLLLLNSSLEFNCAAKFRYEGFIRAIKETSGGVEKFDHITIKNIDSEKAYKKIKEIYTENPRAYDGIFCFNDSTAFGVMKGLQDLNIKIPDDVSVIGYDNTLLSTYMNPSLASVNIDAESEAKLAVEILVNHIYDNNAPIRKEEIDVELIERNSL